MMDRPIIAFDVDGTLVDYNNEPRQVVIDLYHVFERLGFEMWVWSGGGAGYAEFHARRLGLNPDKVFAKDRKLRPHYAVDDIEGADLGTIQTIIVPLDALIELWKNA